MLNSSRDTTEGARRSIGRGEGRGVCLLCDPGSEYHTKKEGCGQAAEDIWSTAVYM